MLDKNPTLPGNEIPAGGLENGKQYFICRRDKPLSPFSHVEYHGLHEGHHNFSSIGACKKPFFQLSTAALCHYIIRGLYRHPVKKNKRNLLPKNAMSKNNKSAKNVGKAYEV
jgi:hypothetical protein